MDAIDFLRKEYSVTGDTMLVDVIGVNMKLDIVIRLMDKYADTKQKLNIASVSGKRPNDLEISDTMYEIGTAWLRPEKAACASSAVDTVAARGHVHKWHETSSKERVCYMCGESEKTSAGSSHEGQP